MTAVTEELGRYPGSRQERRAAVTPPAAVAPVVPTWDAKPIVKTIRGQRMELFPVGALAAALGRSAVTMRLWERNGVLPKAKYRLANKNGVGGRRYYDRAQIEAVVAVARDFQMLGEQRRIHPEFTARVVKAWADLTKGAPSGA